MSRTVLLTGFEPFAGLPFNPAAEVVRALSDAVIDDLHVSSHILPVSYAGHAERLAALLEEIQPCLMLSFGLYAGEDMIRLERIGVNIADFDIADNAGLRLSSVAIEPAGPAARLTTLPYLEIRAALLQQGVPARISNTAGTYLCNATLYSALGLCATHPRPPLCGFIHLPYAASQVAEMLRQESRSDLGTVSPDSVLPSMPLDLMIEAAKTAIRISASHATAEA
jgi:pyroglutamyl-peptidase